MTVQSSTVAHAPFAAAPQSATGSASVLLLISSGDLLVAARAAVAACGLNSIVVTHMPERLPHNGSTALIVEGSLLSGEPPPWIDALAVIVVSSHPLTGSQCRDAIRWRCRAVVDQGPLDSGIARELVSLRDRPVQTAPALVVYDADGSGMAGVLAVLAGQAMQRTCTSPTVLIHADDYWGPTAWLGGPANTPQAQGCDVDWHAVAEVEGRIDADAVYSRLPECAGVPVLGWASSVPATQISASVMDRASSAFCASGYRVILLAGQPAASPPGISSQGVEHLCVATGSPHSIRRVEASLRSFADDVAPHLVVYETRGGLPTREFGRLRPGVRFRRWSADPHVHCELRELLVAHTRRSTQEIVSACVALLRNADE